ncbi:glycosyltransferase family 39 protein [Candidatus Binatia bacterium]|nr:glycosyltransferase family 39 protein [Candidatus Binatia bacterium]
MLDPPRQPRSGGGAPSAGLRWSALAVTLLGAALVRAWNLGWGLEHRMAFPDELAFWQSYLFAFVPPRPASLVGHPLFYPPLYGYLSGLAVAAASALGALGPGQDVYRAFVIARGVSVVASVATVLVVWRLGTRFYGVCTGLLAAAVMASIPFEAMQTHYASVDALLATTTALVLLASARFSRDRRPAWAMVAGACVGLALGVKYNAGALLAVPLWVVLEEAVARRSLRPMLTLGVAVGVGCAVAGAIAAPSWLLETHRALSAFRYMRWQMTGGWLPDGNHAAASLGWYGRPWLIHLVATLPFALGWPAYAASLLGVAVALRRRTDADRVLLVMIAVYVVILGLPTPTFPRYVLPLGPALVVLGARALVGLRLPLSARAVLCTAIVAYGFVLGGSQVARFSYDQQLGVASWLRAAAERSGIPLRVGFPQPLAPYFALREPLGRAGLRPMPKPDGHWFDGSPEAFVMPEWFATTIRRDRNSEARLAALDELESGRAGYREVARWRSSYFQEDLYTWLDPAFASDLYMGELGFRVYLRDDVATRLGLPSPGSAP